MHDNEVILELRNITKAYGPVKAIEGVNLILKKGEVHALIGENGAGKSTLLKVASGYHMPTSGDILLRGEKVVFKSSEDALRAGISMIYQETNCAPHMTVAENIFLNREPLTKFKTVDFKKMTEDAEKLLQSLGVDIEATVQMKDLSVAMIQLVEIAKALSFNSEVIIMDEPTSAISTREIERLFSIIRDLKKQGKAIVFISHKLNEIYEICDAVTIFCDGRQVGCGRMADFEENQLIKLMVGREVKNRYPKVYTEIGDVVLRVDNLSAPRAFKDISFELHKGEILGLAGLVGAGRTEIAETIVGFRKASAGKIYKDGKEIQHKIPEDAFKNGIAMVPEDRKRHGAVLINPIINNVTLSNLPKIMNRFVLNRKKERTYMAKYTEKLQIKTASPYLPVNSMSGGNQQKVVVSRVMFSDPDIIILDEPTRGVDVMTKAEIHALAYKLAGEGKAILLISSEMEELIGSCDRIIAMREGHIVGELTRQEFDQERILSMIMQ